MTTQNLTQGHQNISQEDSKTWRIVDGTMEVKSYGKKCDSDLYMTIDLEFRFDDEPNPKTVGNVMFY